MKTLRALLALLACVLLAVGCGGKGGGSRASRGQGALAVRVVWPPASRVVPSNAQTVLVQVQKPGASGQPPTTVKEAYLNRDQAVNSGATSVTEDAIGGLDAGSYTVVATAYAGRYNKKSPVPPPTTNPFPDAARPLAQGSESGLDIVADQSTPFSVTMGTTLARFKVTELGSNKALTPQEFYLDAAGVTNTSGSRVIPRFTRLQGDTPITVELTPLAEDGKSLLLLPTTPTDAGQGLISVATDATPAENPNQGLVAKYVSSGGSTYRFTLQYQGTTKPAAILTVDYHDYEDGRFVSLKTFATAVQINASATVTIATFSGVPDVGSPFYRIVNATLKEDDEVVNGNVVTVGTSYAGEPVSILPPATPPPPANQLQFKNVQRHGRGFELSATLQALTFGGGYVDVAKIVSEPVDADEAAPAATFGTYYDLSFVTPPAAATTLDAGGVERDGKTYGYETGDTAYGLKVNITDGANNVTAATLRPELFSLKRDSGSGSVVVDASGNTVTDGSGYRIKVNGDQSLNTDTATFSAKLKRTGGASALSVGSTFSVAVKPGVSQMKPTTATFTGLPDTFDGTFFKITGALTETGGATYSGTTPSGNPNQLKFSNVKNNGRSFTLAASLQIKTEDGFVEIANTSKLIPATTNLEDGYTQAFAAADYDKLELVAARVGSVPFSNGVERNGATYGYASGDVNYVLRVKINDADTYSLRPEPFVLSPPPSPADPGSGATILNGYRIKVAGGKSQIDQTANFDVALVRPVTSPATTKIGSFSVKVNKNAGGISVGVG